MEYQKALKKNGASPKYESMFNTLKMKKKQGVG